MTTFLIVAGLLLAVALLFVVPPLLSGRRRHAVVASRNEANVSIYRDQLQELSADLAAGTLSRDQYEQARRELESRVLEDVAAADAPAALAGRGGSRLAIVIGAAVPLVAVSLYFVLGNPKGLDPHAAKPPAADEQGHDVTPEQIAGMVEGLAKRLKENPENTEGWIMLARSYNALQRYPEAAQAYAKAVERKPTDAQLLADYADVLAMAQGRNLMGEPERLVERALKADPENIKALALAGTAEFMKKDYRAAVSHWEKIVALVPPESEFGRSVASSIAEARQKGGLAPDQPPAAAKAPANKAAAAAIAGVSGTVRLSPELAAKVAPSDTVFVFARAASGPRMPLAIVRKEAKDLPLAFSLDDSMALAPGMKLSSFEKVVVGARVSKTGEAMPKPGDLEGATQPVAVGASGLVVTIDSAVK
jgi:cytochrome c-type biogenesis protein CcmH